VMGLAPYAKDEDVERVLTKLRGTIYPDPSNPLVFRSRFNTWDTLHFLDDQFRRTRFDHLAGAAQRLVEELVVDWVNEAVARTGIRTVVLAGGVFMNVKVNKLLMESPSIERLWAMPSAGDESSPIGAAYLASRELGVRDFAPISNVYWGPSFSSSDVENALTETGAFGRYAVTRHEDINAEVARLLAAGSIVARFRGRMEFGARALGNRSILAHPGNPDVIRVINEQVKNRDFWMPFAPSILAEWVDRYVAGTVKTPSPHMMVGFESTNLARTHLRAALHPYDLTMRPQMVTRRDAPDYHDLLTKFASLAGTGGVLNTSFNIHGKPIVMSPRDALAAFAHCGLQVMALEDYLVTKSPSGVEM
jgi:carbamoyltransferase